MDLTNLNKDRKTRRKSAVDLTTMVYGKLPPQARPMEEAVLGAVMQDRSAFDRLVEVFSDPEVFYVEAHRDIFMAMKALAQKSMPIDELTVIEQLRKMEKLELIGGPYYVTSITNNVTGSASIQTHARIVYEKFIAREIIRISGELISEAYEDTTDPFELMELAEKELSKLVNSTPRSSYRGVDVGLVNVIRKIEALRHQESHITGIPSMFRNIDKITHGWQNTDFIILAARPSVGKTAFMLNLVRSAVFNDIKPTAAGIFSLEMSEEQLIQRMASIESEIFLEKIITGRMDDEDMRHLYETAVKKLGTSPIYIDDTPGLNIFQLRAKARRMKNKNNVGLIFIDYLQLMSGPDERRNSNREQEISKISRDLKGLAKELSIPIIALSQLSRKIEDRKGDAKKPQLADLRESGAIEQDADLVMFLYRPEADEDDPNNGKETILDITKHRNGNLAKGNNAIRLESKLEIQKFFNCETFKTEQPALPLGSNWKPVKDITEANKKDLPF
jgi:replicative DNA helicase